MLTRTAAISRETRNSIKERLAERFQYEQGEDLGSVVSEVLNDKDVFLFFSSCLKKNQGLCLGFMRYWDDTDVRVPYGLILYGEPSKLRVYHYETLRVGLTDFHPRLSGIKISEKDMFGGPAFSQSLPKTRFGGRVSYEGYPSSKDFVRLVNVVLKNPEKYTIEFSEEVLAQCAF